MTTVDWITLIIAIWGALTGTAAAILLYREHRQSIKVQCFEHSFIEHGTPVEAITIKAVNAGHRRVVVEDAGFLLSDGSTVGRDPDEHWLTWPLPIELEDGQRVEVGFRRSYLEMNLQVLWRRKPEGVYTHGYVTAAKGKRYRARTPESHRGMSAK